MQSPLVRVSFTAVLFWLATASAASAQIYSWRDSSGALVVSDRPQAGTMQTYAVAESPAIRTTRAALTGQATAYDDLIVEHSATHGVNPSLVRAVIQAESAFNPRARSVKGAMGLMQLMPATAAEYGVLDPYSPAENIRAGVAYLKSLMTRYNNDVSLALAAYNAGPTAVEKYGRTVPPYRETRKYVARIKKDTDAAKASHSPTAIYKVVRVVNGHEIVSYSNKPSPGAVLVSTR